MKRLFLIGFMGCGKSTVGKQLATALNCQFVDLDLFLEQRHQQSVSTLFAQVGEPTFRKYEQRALHEVSEFENVVISTGGGTPCFFDNMNFMLQAGLVCYFDNSIECLVSRLMRKPRKRPLVGDKSREQLIESMQKLLNERLPFYRKAQYLLKADGKDQNQMVSELLTHIAYNPLKIEFSLKE